MTTASTSPTTCAAPPKARLPRASPRALPPLRLPSPLALSGSAGGSYLGDITIPLLGIDRVVECKVRGTGFRALYAWLEQRDLLIVRADKLQPLVILPLKLAIEIAMAAEKAPR